jgi:hypothetical protein
LIDLLVVFQPPHLAQIIMIAISTLVLALTVVCAAEDGGVTVAVRGPDLHISTPGHNGTVLIDGSVDVKKLDGNIKNKADAMQELNTTLQTVLNVNRVQQVGPTRTYLNRVAHSFMSFR